MRKYLIATTMLASFAQAVHAQTTGSGSAGGLNYVTLTSPDGCSTANPCQILEYLHPLGEENKVPAQVQRYFNNSAFWAANPHTIVVAPMINRSSSTNNWGGVTDGINGNMTAAVDAVKQIEATVPTNPDDVTLTGGSMGAIGGPKILTYFGPKGTQQPGVYSAGLFYDGAPYQISDSNAMATLCGVPLTIVHGTADTTVSPSGDQHLATVMAGCPGYSFVSIPGMTHGSYSGSSQGYDSGTLIDATMAAARSGPGAAAGLATVQASASASALTGADEGDSSAPSGTAMAVSAAVETPQLIAAASASAAATAAQAALAPGQGSVTDCNGTTWTISADGHVMQGSLAVTGGGGTSALQLVGCTVWGQDNGNPGNNSPSPGGWFTLGDDGWDISPTPPPAAGSAAAAADAATAQQTAVPLSPMVTQAVCGSVAPSGTFKTVNGQIIGPNGPFAVRGINVYGNQDAMKNGALMTQTFNGLNFIRYIVRTLDDPSTYQAFVNQMTPQGIVIEFEHHPDGGGGQDAPYTGAQLAAESAWYASMATTFKANPYVWFGTFNEPGVGYPGQLSAWHQATYNAIRGTGSNAPLMIEPGGSRPWNLVGALVPSVYASMTNIIMDPHVYPYQNDYNSDPTSITDNVKGMVTAAQKIKSADGTIPVIVGEAGPSTTGSSLDANGYAMVEGLINVAQTGAMAGVALFTWYPGFASPNNLTDPAGTPTAPYGQMAQLFINTSVIPCTAPQTAAYAQQATSEIEQQISQDPTTPTIAAPTAANAILATQNDDLVKQAQAVAAAQ